MHLWCWQRILADIQWKYCDWYCVRWVRRGCREARWSFISPCLRECKCWRWIKGKFQLGLITVHKSACRRQPRRSTWIGSKFQMMRMDRKDQARVCRWSMSWRWKRHRCSCRRWLEQLLPWRWLRLNKFNCWLWWVSQRVKEKLGSKILWYGE